MGSPRCFRKRTMFSGFCTSAFSFIRPPHLAHFSRGEPASFARREPSREGLARPSEASGEEGAGGGPKGEANPPRVPISIDILGEGPFEKLAPRAID
jgi:hypothetical protein